MPPFKIVDLTTSTQSGTFQDERVIRSRLKKYLFVTVMNNTFNRSTQNPVL